ncbi:cardioacceleratory peptide receptor [Argonauta hians]
MDAIARPLQFTGSGSRSRILVSVAWGCAVLFSSPSLFLFKEVTSPVDDSVKLCYLHFPEQWHWMVYITVLAVGLFIIPTIIIIICYTSILYVIWNQGKMLQSLEHSRNGRHTWRNTLTKTASKDGDASSLPASSCSSSRGVIPKAKIKTIKMTFLIVLAFITCWSPYMIFSLLQVYDRIPATATMQAVATFFQSLAPLNSVANPIIYGVFNVCRCGNRDGACFSEVVCKWFGKTQRRASGPLRSETSGYLTTEMETKLTQREHSDKMSPGRRDSGLPYVKTAISETDRKILLRNLSSVAPEKGTNQLNIGESKI